MSSKGSDAAGKSPTRSSNRKIILYALIGVLAVAAVSVSVFSKQATTGNPPDTNQTAAAQEQEYRQQFCGLGFTPKSTDFIREISLPSQCEVPLAVYVDNNNTVWYVSTKDGALGSFNTAAGTFGKEYKIPSWQPRNHLVGAPEMVWDLKPDKSGNMWLVTEGNAIWKFDRSTEKFYVYKTPEIYPSSFDFDNNGNIYFTGFFAKSLWYADVSKLKNGTSEGISEIPLPLDAFKGLNATLGSGSITIDRAHNAVWLPVLAFDQKGVIYHYDAATKHVDNYTLPPELKSPSSTALDSSGRLWVTDHATSTFFSLDPSTKSITSYVTSTASPRLFDGQTVPNAYTLPYWIKASPTGDGALWFNEHEGNQIAKFNPSNETLTEYWIPTQNPIWSGKEGCTQCGLANALQLAIGQSGEVWFSEWTQNNIAELDAGKQAPVSVTTEKTDYKVQRGGSLEIRLNVNANSDFKGNMISSGTLTPTGSLGNSTGTFSEPSVNIAKGDSKQLSYVFEPSPNLKPGNYTLMLGTANDQISYLKAVHVTLTAS
ncbi:MAG: hypothetical protein ABI361_02265 [Nitrososphaera sp.]